MTFKTMIDLVKFLEWEIDCGGSPEHWALAKDIKAMAVEVLSPAIHKAWELTHTDRRAAYGEPSVVFAGYAKIWSGLLAKKLNQDLTAGDVALLMTALKLARQANHPAADNIVDAHGYLIMHEEV